MKGFFMNNSINCNSSRCERKNMPIAMAYVPWQEFRNLDNFKNGYNAGTIFKDLNKPFMGGRHLK